MRWSTVVVITFVNIAFFVLYEFVGVEHEESQEPQTGGRVRRTNPQQVRSALSNDGEHQDRSQPCMPQFSSFRCVDMGEATFIGSKAAYGFSIVNRSCVYNNIVFDSSTGQFIFHAETADITQKSLPPVTLAARPYDLPIRRYKQIVLKRKVRRAFDWKPTVVNGPIPCSLEHDSRTLLFYAPIVAPWNYAHTLLCDMFSLFWAMWELGISGLLDAQVVAYGAHYASDFPLPNNNAAFKMFSTRPPVYDSALPTAVYKQLVVGSGTKTWSWLTTEYRSSGDSELWWSFRQHIIDVTGAVSSKKESGTIRVSICHKKDKRGIYNYEEVVRFLRGSLSDQNAVFELESAVGRTPKEQVELMLNADVYVCNEGTLATTFFLMREGSVFLSVPLVYHLPHLHQRHMPSAAKWWALPDLMRPDPRLNTGGNIDFFPPAIPWVRVLWYDHIPMNETRIRLPLVNLRNYMPDFNIVIMENKMVPLMERAIQLVGAAKRNSQPNYSVNAQLCRDILAKAPELTRSFNTARCFYGMSWLCECWTNSRYKWRLLHEKWSLSRGNCGDERSSPESAGLEDPRTERSLREFLFFNRQQIETAYRSTDLGNLSATQQELDDIFQEAS